VLSEEKLNEISGNFDHAPQKFVRCLAEETGVSSFQVYSVFGRTKCKLLMEMPGMLA
jgi:hypothetical protein